MPLLFPFLDVGASPVRGEPWNQIYKQFEKLFKIEMENYLALFLIMGPAYRHRAWVCLDRLSYQIGWAMAGNVGSGSRLCGIVYRAMILPCFGGRV